MNKLSIKQLERQSGFDTWERLFNPLTTSVPDQIETSQLICRQN